MREVIIPLFSDTHAGNKLGLMNPDVQLPQETETGELVPYTPAMTEMQRHLWGLWMNGVEAARELAHGNEIIPIHNGDATQGTKYQQSWVSTRLSDQIAIADANMQPWLSLENVKTWRYAIGTGAHNGGEGTTEYELAARQQKQYPEKDIQAAYHGLATINGVTIDYAHHGPHPGGRSWLKGNVARYYLRDIMISELTANRLPPKIVVRGHYHTLVIERVQMDDCESWIIILPSFCGLDDHSVQAVRSPDTICNGLVLLETVDGELLNIHERKTVIDIRTKETL